jgi:arabinan endo-1,5-alpha-L-arabinosidase
MISSYRVSLVGLFVAVLFVTGAYAQTQPKLSGNLFIHDPSIIVIDGHYASFATGLEQSRDEGMPRTKTSPDGMTWTDTGSIPAGLPHWIPEELGRTPANIWAPSVTERDGTVSLYYSASRFGFNTSVIGLMTNNSFDPSAPAKGWIDRGLVIRSLATDDFNAIDPFRIDTSDGAAWLSFGSYWDGIRLVALDLATGKPAASAEMHRIASRHGGAVEASSILEHEGRFYLFVSFDQCCRGEASTYRIMIGRADAVTGPYIDKAGKPMLEGGGTEFFAANRYVVGPGGQEVFEANGEDMLVYHYYSRRDLGMPTLQIAPLNWDEAGWPYLDPMP